VLSATRCSLSLKRYRIAKIVSSPRSITSDERTRAEDIEKIPTSWLDSILTGPDAVVGRPPYDCRHVEAILRAVKQRLEDAQLPQGE